MAAGTYGQGRSRTADTAVFSRMLYRLSYLPFDGGIEHNPPYRKPPGHVKPLTRLYPRGLATSRGGNLTRRGNLSAAGAWCLA